MKWINKAKSWFKKNRNQEVKLDSKDTAGALLNAEIITDDINKIGQLEPKIIAKDKVAKKIDEELSVVIDKERIKVKLKKMDKKVKALDILRSYGLTRRQAKRYLRYKYILKHTKKNRIRLKANKILCDFKFNDKYKGEEF